MAHTLSVDDCIALGKGFYKEKKYEKALEQFKRAVNRTVRPTVQMLDYCAACHYKLQDFDRAIKKGREAIQTDRVDIRGYLRVTGVLEKQNKIENAIQVYKLGMKHVPVENKDWKILQKQHDRLVRFLAPPGATDPLTVLPREMIDMILRELSFRQLVNLLRVSQSWKTYLINIPELWVNLDLSEASKAVSRNFVRNAVRYSRNQLISARFFRFPYPDMIRNIATLCKNLTYIEFSDCRMLSDTIIEAAQCARSLEKLVLKSFTTADTLTQVLRHRPTLQHIEVNLIVPSSSRLTSWKGPFPNLRYLRLYNQSEKVPPPSNLNVDQLLTEAPALEHLEFWNIDSSLDLLVPDFSHTILKELHLRDYNFVEWPSLPSTLTHLTIAPKRVRTLPLHGGQNQSVTNLQSWQNAQNTELPNLVHLSLRSLADITPAFISELLSTKESSASTIRTFELRGSSMAPSDTYRLFHPEGGILYHPRLVSPSLRHLSLDICTDQDIEDLIQSPVDGLHTAYFYSAKLTGAGVKMLVDKYEHTLKRIDLIGCHYVTSRDVVDYALGKGIAMRWVDGEASGRKVRYG